MNTKIIEENTLSMFDKSLPALAKKWRKEVMNIKLEQAKHILGMSIAYISELENGVVEFSDRAFLAYHRVAPEMFPMELASKLPIPVIEATGAASKKKGAFTAKTKGKSQ